MRHICKVTSKIHAMKVNGVQSLLGMLVAVLGLSSCAASRQRAYDVRPENRAALYQERKASPHYRMDNEHTFPVYREPYTVDSPEGRGLFSKAYYELYRAEEATYVTATYKCPESMYFYHFNSGCAIIDNKTGDRYMLREVEYCPVDTCFWIKGSKDKFVRFVLVFPPLPKKVKTVDFFIPSSASRFNFDGSEKHMSGLRVEDLRPKHRIPQGEVIR